MDNYQGYDNFVTCYEVDESKNQMTIQYADGSEATCIHSDHNMKVMEERLYNQHRTIMEERLPEWERKIRTYKTGSVLMSVCVGTSFALETSTIAMAPLCCIGVCGYKIYKDSKPIQRLKLTDYCLKNADAIKFTKTESILQPKLSESGREVFEKDGGFTLNHAHLYTDKDLKELKKVIKK